VQSANVIPANESITAMQTSERWWQASVNQKDTSW